MGVVYRAVDTRLRRREQAREQAAAAPEKPAAEAGPTAAENKVYEAALNQFKLGNYSAAISTLQGLLVTYPESKLAPNAQYWIGESYYGKQKFSEAVEAWNTLLKDYPSSDKLPDARVKKGMALEKLGRRSQALLE